MICGNSERACSAKGEQIRIKSTGVGVGIWALCETVGRGVTPDGCAEGKGAFVETIGGVNPAGRAVGLGAEVPDR